MAGLPVSRPTFDQKSSEAILSLRDALRRCEVIYNFLEMHPADAPEGDILELSAVPENPMDMDSAPGFAYDHEDAVLVRELFTKIHDLDTAPVLTLGRKLTGLE